MDTQVKLKIKLELTDLNLMPSKASPDSAGYDLKARQEYFIAPGQTVFVATGVKLALPEGSEAQVRPRSGLSAKSRLRLSNSPGTIDADYRDEIKVILHNDLAQSELPSLVAAYSPLLERFGPICQELSLLDYLARQGREVRGLENLYPQKILHSPVYLDREGRLWGTEHILQYERIGQLVCQALDQGQFELVPDVKAFGSDRGGGFGHTGRL